MGRGKEDHPQVQPNLEIKKKKNTLKGLIA